MRHPSSSHVVQYLTYLLLRYGVAAGAEAFATSVASGIEGVLVCKHHPVALSC